MNFAIPPVTWVLLILNVGFFLLQQLVDPLLTILFGLWPLGSPTPGAPAFQPWQILTYGFLHSPSNFGHLFFNMFALYMFGADLERAFGEKRYIIYYLVCVVSAGLLQLLVTFGGPAYPTIGASGGVFGLLLAFGLLYPRRTIMLLIPPIPMPAWLFVTLYGLLELFLGVTGSQAGVAHFAHLGGMAGGFLLIRYWQNQHRRRRS